MSKSALICLNLRKDYSKKFSKERNVIKNESNNIVSKSGLRNTISTDGNYAILNGQKILITGNTIDNIYKSVKQILGY